LHVFDTVQHKLSIEKKHCNYKETYTCKYEQTCDMLTGSSIYRVAQKSKPLHNKKNRVKLY